MLVYLRDHMLVYLRDHMLVYLRDHMLVYLRDHMLVYLRDHMLRQVHVVPHLDDSTRKNPHDASGIRTPDLSLWRRTP